MATWSNSASPGIGRNTVVIPFGFSYLPLKKLALINFEKNPDSMYVGLEPQYFHDDDYGRGYRVIAYRNDGFVDVYDDPGLHDDKDDSFDVTGKGLCERIKTVIEQARFEKQKDGCVTISFQFTDKYGRLITAGIEEQAKRKTRGLNLLAPVGSSTENPSYLPMFFLYNFDFVRKRNTKLDLKIGGRSIKPDHFPFPIPKDMQWRYFTRYSDDCQIIEFANARTGVLQECIPDEDGRVVQGSVEYQFNESGALLKMWPRQSDHRFLVEFRGGLPDVRSMSNHSEHEDTFKISADDGMGFVSGEYSVRREGRQVQVQLVPAGGWRPDPDSWFTKIMFGNKSVFCSWPKTYRYSQVIDASTLVSTSFWKRVPLTD